MASKPVLCAQCHYSPALDLAGTGAQGDQVGKPTMSVRDACLSQQQDAGLHGRLGPPGRTPDSQTQACYTCHPGRDTKCLRGAMTETVNCQNCHGTMAPSAECRTLKVGGSIDGTNDGKPRRPWTDLPRCQSCHTGDAVNYLKLDPSLMAIRRPPYDRRIRPERIRPHRRDSPTTRGSPRTAASCSGSARATAVSPAKRATTVHTRSGRIRSTRTTTTSQRWNFRDTLAPWSNARPAMHPVLSPSR